MFPDKVLVHKIQKELDGIIHSGVQNIVKLVHQTNNLEDTKDTVVKSVSLSSVSLK